MAKKINYPTPEWIDRWVDNWMDAHPDERVSDFDELKAQAEDAWWLNEVEHDRPTPFDLTPEQEKVSREARLDKGKGKETDPDKPKAKRERKPNEEKREIVQMLFEALRSAGFTETAVANVEREVTFKAGENAYSVTLTLHRPKKGKE